MTDTPKLEWDFVVLDHKWNNLKRWVDCCENKFGKDGFILVGRMGDMMRTIEEMDVSVVDTIMKSLSENDV